MSHQTALYGNSKCDPQSNGLTKQHIDGYLTIAEVAMEWIVEPGGGREERRIRAVWRCWRANVDAGQVEAVELDTPLAWGAGNHLVRSAPPFLT
jgi:hypothetical protein